MQGEERHIPLGDGSDQILKNKEEIQSNAKKIWDQDVILKINKNIHINNWFLGLKPEGLEGENPYVKEGTFQTDAKL